MQNSILAAKTQLALESISEKLGVDITMKRGLQKGLRELRILEAIDQALDQVDTGPTPYDELEMQDALLQRIEEIDGIGEGTMKKIRSGLAEQA